MPLSLRRGRVTAVLERAEGLVRLEVDRLPCVAYPRLTGEVEVGDDVVVNEQARVLGLGSGGFDLLHTNLTRGLALAADTGAHVMKLPYTPVQAAMRHVEEDAPLAETLEGMPVVCSTLHSQVAPVCAALRGRRVVYVQVPGGALPVSLSEAVRAVRAAGLAEAAVAVGACVDGDVAAVNVASALAWARAAGAEAAVVSVGPGIVGTGSWLGHGAVAAAEAANAAAALGGVVVLAVRASEADPRERHRGVSHHVAAVRRLCLAPVRLPWPVGTAGAPEGAEEVRVDGWREACRGLPLSHMGRGPDDDPLFFAAAYAAGALAATLLP